jgi:hypothetical protein
VLKGLKYGANAWIHNRDYKKAYEMSCQWTSWINVEIFIAVIDGMKTIRNEW